MKMRTNLKSSFVVSVFLLAIACATATAGTIYVDAGASGSNDGSSWVNAHIYLQDALTAGVSGDEIWVVQGTYKPDANTANPGGTSDRTATFQLKNGVAVYGGFAGGESTLDERDWQSNATILSGDISTPDVNTDNSYHVVTGSGTNSTAILDGFTITAGNANGSNPYNKGGGMYNASGNPTVTNCTFSDNSAAYTGGGMCNYPGSSPTVTNCTFSENSADIGGGMHNAFGNTTVTNCTFSDNSAGWGGGMYNAYSSQTLTNCTFIGNSAGNHGGGLVSDNSSPTMTNCTFSGNAAETYGGAIGTSQTYATNQQATVTNCTFAGNSATNGNCIGCDSFEHLYPTTVQLTNCILWDGGAEIWNNDGSTITITYSDVQGGWPGTGNIAADPRFVSGPWGDYYLSHIAAGQISNSPCIDAGSDLASALGMDTFTTRIDHVTDAGQVDMGYHHPPDFPVSALDALIDIDPDTLNKKSHGRWVTVYITLPDGLDVAGIDTSSVAITSLVGASCVPDYSQAADLGFVPQVGDRDEDGIADLTVKFDRQVLLSNLCLDDVAVTIEGELTTGEHFSGSDTIRIIDRGK